MTCWHIHRPMTPVPIQPTRVLPGSTLVTGMAPPSRMLALVVNTPSGNLDDLAERGAAGKCCISVVSSSAAILKYWRGSYSDREEWLHDRPSAALPDCAGPRAVRLRPS